jgi:hypothetical protein
MGNNIIIWKAGATRAAGLSKLDLIGSGESLNQVTRRLPEGGYTTFRTFGKHKVLRLSDHYNRLEETAALAGISLCLDREWISHLLRTALAGVRL